MRFEAACCTKEIVSREEWNGNKAEGTVGGGDLISSKRLEVVMTEWFTLIKWGRDLSQRAGRQGKVRKAEGVCAEWERAWGMPMVLWGTGEAEHEVCVKCAGQTENGVGEAPVSGGCRSVHRGKGPQHYCCSGTAVGRGNQETYWNFCGPSESWATLPSYTAFLTLLCCSLFGVFYTEPFFFLF